MAEVFRYFEAVAIKQVMAWRRVMCGGSFQ